MVLNMGQLDWESSNLTTNPLLSKAIGNLYKNIQLMLEFFKALFLVLQFSYYILMIFLMNIICNIAIYVDDTILCSKCDQASDLWKQLIFASELESDLRYTVDCGRKWLVNFNAGKTQLVLFGRFSNTGTVDTKMNGSLLEKKSTLKMLGLNFSSQLDWGSYITFVSKTAFKKIGALICSMMFLAPEVVLYLHKFTM